MMGKLRLFLHDFAGVVRIFAQDMNSDVDVYWRWNKKRMSLLTSLAIAGAVLFAGIFLMQTFNLGVFALS